MKVQDCPKNMYHCTNNCPIFPCFAYEQHLTNKDQEKREKNQGWE